MNILSLFVVIPALMLLGLWIARNVNQVRGVMVAGSSCLLAMSVWLTLHFISERAGGNTEEMILHASTAWFPALHINYEVGVDGISVVMLLLSSIIVFTGTFASWKLKPLTKEFFMWFTLLSTGVYGFFISIDLFTMFMFYEVALIPMYLLIGFWGSGRKEYAAMKLTLMLMGGSALIILGLVGIYFFNGASTMNTLRLRTTTTSRQPFRTCCSRSCSSVSACLARCSRSTHGLLSVTVAPRHQCLCSTQVCS